MNPNVFAQAMIRELRTLKREVEAYPDEASLWHKTPELPNSAGNLVLHLAGNIQHFVGAELGRTGYTRDRAAEFSRTGVSKAELQQEIDKAITAVDRAFAGQAAAQLGELFPSTFAGLTLTRGEALVHLTTHLAYHLGQVDYHRRLVARSGTAVGAIVPGEVRAQGHGSV